MGQYPIGKDPVGKRKGPGHHTFFRKPGTGEWMIAYHRWENQTGNGPYSGSRQVCLDRVDYDDTGLIRPIVMTVEAAASPPAK